MRILTWLIRAFLFLALFGFAINNQQLATVNWLFSYAWTARMVIIVLAAFIAGTVFGVLVAFAGCLRGMQCGRSTANRHCFVRSRKASKGFFEFAHRRTRSQ